MNRLKNILSPMTISEFFEKYWTKEYLLVRGSANKFNKLFNWNKYNDLLEEHIENLSFPSIRLASCGKIVPEYDIIEYTYSRKMGSVKRISAKKINDQCKKGATLIVDRVNKLNSSLSKLTDSLAFELGEKVQINSYCSWGGTQGFDIHYDVHEVFIIQVEGSKEWDLYQIDNANYPILNGKEAPPSNTSPIRLTLKKGDILYIPRGMWHSALAKNEPSLHLTVGVTCSKKIDFLRWILMELQENEVDLRENIEIRNHLMNKNGYSIESLVKIINDLQKSLKDIANDKEWIQKFNYHSFSAINNPKKFGFPYSILEDPIEDQNILFYRPLNQKFLIIPIEEEGIKILHNNKELFFKGDTKKLVNGIFNNYQMTGREILEYDKEFTWNDIKPILTTLVNEQVLFIQGR